MPNSSPPWVRQTQVVVTVENVAIVPEAATEVAAGGIGHYAGDDTEYQVVKSWEVDADTVGELKEISVTGTVLAKTHWRVVIGSLVFANHLLIGAPLTMPFFDLKLVAGTLVTVYCKSTDGTSINADASIVAKEIG